MKFGYPTAILLCYCLTILCGCTQSVILLSPEDHYVLGNYFIEHEKAFKAKEQFELIRDKYPTSKYATMSQFKLAQTQFARKHYAEAAVDFSLFLEFHPAHKLAPFAQYHLALCKYELMLSPDRDTTVAQEARDEFMKFLKAYPDHSFAPKAKEYLTKVQENLLRHEYEVGMVYYRRKNYNAALTRFKPTLLPSGDSDLFLRANYYAGKSYEHKEAYAEARKCYQAVIDTASASKWVRKARKRLKKLPAATEKTSENKTDSDDS